MVFIQKLYNIFVEYFKHIFPAGIYCVFGARYGNYFAMRQHFGKKLLRTGMYHMVFFGVDYQNFVLDFPCKIIVQNVFFKLHGFVNPAVGKVGILIVYVFVSKVHVMLESGIACISTESEIRIRIESLDRLVKTGFPAVYSGIESRYQPDKRTRNAVGFGSYHRR